MLRAHPERASMIAEVGQTSRHEEPALVVYVCFLGTDDEGGAPDRDPAEVQTAL